MVKKGQISAAKDAKHTGKGKLAPQGVQGRSSRRALIKTQPAVLADKRPPRSKPGFSLYSSDSEGDEHVTKAKAKVKSGIQSRSDALNKVPHLQSTALGKGEDVVSQIQVEMERQTGIVIPTAGLESPENRSMNVDDFPFQGGGTPFNRRLISSTPDPERLQDLAATAPVFNEKASGMGVNPSSHKMDSPQMVPERDTSKPAPPSVIQVSVSGDLYEKLKRQRKQGIRHGQPQQQVPQLQKKSDLVAQEINQPPQHPGKAVVDSSTWASIFAAQEPVFTPLDPASRAEWVTESGHGSEGKKSSSVHSTCSPRIDIKKDVSAPQHQHTDKDNEALVPGPAPITATQASSFVPVASGSRHDQIALTGSQYNTQVQQRHISDDCHVSKPCANRSEKNNSKGSKDDTPRAVNLQSNIAQKVNSSSRKFMSLKVKPKTPDVKKRNIHNVKKGKLSVLDQRGEDSPPSSAGVEHVSPLQSVQKPLLSSPKEKHDPNSKFDNSTDTCDEEVSRVVGEARNICMDDYGQTGLAEKTDTPPASPRSDLSQVIELLKTNAFPAVNEQIVTARTGQEFVEREALHGQSSASHINLQTDTDAGSDNNNALCERASSSRNLLIDPDRIGANSEEGVHPETAEININQNHNSDDEDSAPPERRNQSLEYLERMADPQLRDIACKLAFKATALRDVELRDLIDDMIFLTNAALAHEDARYQSSQVFFEGENNKLKKRIQNVNYQLEMKERQERMGESALTVSNNDVLHLERKNMYLQSEKDKLDSQVTTLLEEKARWLLTQQDLVKTISLKDHEILKLEQKHQEEKISLHQTLDQKTKNSQGMHYKLSVADREILNLENKIKTKDREIVELKDRLAAEGQRLKACESRSEEKDLEVIRLQDLVDTLKIGVDQVLAAYEGSSMRQESTTTQKQSMAALRMMARPKHYRALSDPGKQARQIDAQSAPREERRAELHQADSNRRSRRTLVKYDEEDNLRYPHVYGAFPPREQRLRADDGPGFLTSRALEEHNRALSPVNRLLWRSFDERQLTSPVQGEEPYHSDSEIHTRDYRKRSLQKHYRTQDLQNGQAFPYEQARSGRGKARPAGQKTFSKNQRLKSANTKGSREMRERNETLQTIQDAPMRIGSHRGYQDNRMAEGSLRDFDEQDDNADYDIGATPEGNRQDEDEELEVVSIVDSQGMNENELIIGGRDYIRHFHEPPMNSRGNLRANGHTELSSDMKQKASRFYTSRKDNHPSLRKEMDNFSKATPNSNLRSQTVPKSKKSTSRVTHASTLHSISLSEEPSTLRQDQKAFYPQSMSSTDGRMHAEKITSRDMQLMDSYPTQQHHHERSLRRTDNTQLDSVLFSHGLSASFPSMRQRTLMEEKGHASHGGEFYGSHHHHSTAQDFPEQESKFVSLRSDPRSHSQSDPSRIVRVHLDHLPPHSHSFPQSRSSENKRNYGFSEAVRTEERAGSSHPLPHSHRDRSHYSDDFNMRRGIMYEEQGSEGSSVNLPEEFRSAFLSGGRPSLPTQSSPVHLSDMSISRRATRGTSDLTQQDFFQGTELSASLSSISESDTAAICKNNNRLCSIDEDSFSTGIASLDEKIARLQEKINRTKAVFS